MARNRVQYQKGLSKAEFERQYGSEEQCRAALAKWRWPDGFVCPHCGGRRHSLIKTRALYQEHRLPAADVADRRDDLCGDPACAAHLVSRPLLTWAAVRTPPMSYRLLKLAETHA